MRNYIVLLTITLFVSFSLGAYAKDYTPDLEGLNVDALINACKIKLSEKVNLTSLLNLQVCHDSSNSPENMESKLHKFAKNHNLKIPKV